ncbi:glycosyltransferase [Maribacter dokdonensis]|uniref:glycosyltransferase n=1 Tax=Maribacter dokdonensis TaxID=320912 RepID=UPI002737104C|nr:glycosyltransferase [Maribacter dokdonensis]MDP2527935.1 glycosyltransferase [Maribacter dokdonensis]
MDKFNTTKNKIKIFFFIPSLRAGGAERVVSFVAQKIDKSKFETTLFVIGSNKDATFKVSDVNIKFLNHDRVSRSFGSVFKTIKKGKPDIVFGTIGHVNIMLGLCKMFFPKITFIGREVNVISKLAEVQHIKATLPPWLNKYLMHKLDVMVCQSIDMANDIKQLSNFPEDKIAIINNPISDKYQLKIAKQDKSKPLKLITVGSLSGRKGHLRILEVLKDLKIPFSYTMVGNGELKDEIFDVIEKYNLTEKISHIAFSNEVSTLLQQHDIFLLGSFVEGFPNVLLESCAVGTPVIAFNAPGGINEIIIEDINGYIAENQKEYLDKILLAASKDWDIAEIRNAVVSRYNERKIIADYENLFLSKTKN